MLKTLLTHTHTLAERDTGKQTKQDSAGYRILCIRIFSDERRIRAFVARLTRTQTTQAKANVEPECQSLDLHQHPNQTHTKGQTWSLNANHWTYISIRTNKTHTGTQMPLDGLTSASKHTTTQQVDRESGTRAYNCQAHTQTNRQQVAKESGTRA